MQDESGAFGVHLKILGVHHYPLLDRRRRLCSLLACPALGVERAPRLPAAIAINNKVCYSLILISIFTPLLIVGTLPTILSIEKLGQVPISNFSC